MTKGFILEINGLSRYTGNISKIKKNNNYIIFYSNVEGQKPRIISSSEFQGKQILSTIVCDKADHNPLFHC